MFIVFFFEMLFEFLAWDQQIHGQKMQKSKEKNKENKSTIEENQRKPLKSNKNTVKSSKHEGNQ